MTPSCQVVDVYDSQGNRNGSDWVPCKDPKCPFNK